MKLSLALDANDEGYIVIMVITDDGVRRIEREKLVNAELSARVATKVLLGLGEQGRALCRAILDGTVRIATAEDRARAIAAAN